MRSTSHRRAPLGLPSAIPILATALLQTACGGAKEDVVLTFPDQASRQSTSVVAVTAFEPLLFSSESDVPQLVRCQDIGVFPPTRLVDPDTLPTTPNLGRLLSEHRQNQTYPFDGDWSIDIPNVKEGSASNPWGAVLVYIEARGEVRSTPMAQGVQVSATLLSGCYCLRTRDGSHPNRVLDQAVKTACSPLGNGGNSRTVALSAVMPRAFKLEPASVQALVSPRNQLVSPGPIVGITTRRCSDTASSTEDCFRCTQPCRELEDLGNVPIMFTVDQPGGSTSPARQIVLADKAGKTRGQITVDSCTSDIEVKAQVVGRADTEVDFTVKCVDPVSGFRCDETPLPTGKEPQGITRIPSSSDGVDFVAILYDSGTNASVEVMNPLRPNATRTLDFPGESARAVYGFYFQLGSRPSGGRADGSRPSLAVVTSKSVASSEQLRLYIYEWKDGELVPQGGGTGLGTPITGDCRHTVCDSPVACNLMVEFQSEVSISSADIDGDHLADLAISTSSGLPITTYYSSRSTAPNMYEADGCTCGQYAQPPTAFQLLELGGPGEQPQAPLVDLVIGAPGGAFVRYGVQGQGNRTDIPCGQPARFGGLVPVRDLAHGHFACDRTADATCDGLDDVVLVAAQTLGGGSFDDPGTIRVIYGTAQDLSLQDDLFDLPGATIELVPRALADKAGEDPRDPRSARVADVNSDGFDDLAVLFRSSEEVHVWLGGADHGLGEVANGVNLKKCDAGNPPDTRCSPLDRFVLADFDGNGTNELAVVCDPTSSARLRRYEPQVTP